MKTLPLHQNLMEQKSTQANVAYLTINIKDGRPNFINKGLAVMPKLINKINGSLNALPLNKIRAGLTQPFQRKGCPAGRFCI